MTQVAIIGGGVAGLSAAYECHTRGLPFVLFESRPRLGGVVFSEQVDGFTIDGGPDSLLVQKPAAIALCREIGLGDRLVPTKPPRLAYIQRGGRLHPLPAASVLGIPTEWGPFIRTSLFSWPGKLRMGAELFVPRKTDETDESIGAFMTRRFGREATEFLAEPLLAGIHAGDVDRLSVGALFPRFTDAEREHGSLLRAFRNQPRPASTDGAFRSLPGGLSEMIEALERALPGASLKRGVGVTALTPPPGFEAGSGAHVESGTYVGSGFGRTSRFTIETSTGERFSADAVIVATPSFVSATLLRDLSPALSRLSAEIPYASAATVAMAFRRDAIDHSLNGSGFVVPRAERTGILAGSWLSSKWPHRAPEGFALLRVFFGGARDPKALELSDQAMVTRGLNALRPLLGIRSEPVFTRVYRWERANAQHEVGHLARLAAIERELSTTPGLFITGSGYRGVGIPDCVADGRATAAQAAQWIASSVSLPAASR